jgi:hypothetical protein
MYIIRHFFKAFPFLIFLCFASGYAFAETVESTEVEVYAAYINQYAKGIHANKSLVIESSSELLDNALFEDPVSDIKTLIPEASETVISDFLRLGSSSASLDFPRRLVLAQIKFSIADAKTIRKIFENDSLAKAWKQYYSAYPSATGLIRFSRVGIDVEKKQALLYKSLWCGTHCGDGALIFMQQQRGHWKIVRSVQLWVS